ncbi:MAG TPA: hypothetical protein VNN08_19885 [Thermoanaerobaculia bacterium]|nr:hypothetical protein [Thermoanaerobaculia bacterium]
MITGSLASSLHGEPRTTHDVDLVIVITREQLRLILERFKRMGLYVSAEAAGEALEKKTDFNVIDFSGGWKVDLVIRKDRPFSLIEFDRRREVEYDGTQMPIASAEDVVIAKLEWAKIGGSDRQIEDVAGILRVQKGTLDIAYIEEWVSSLELAEQWQIAQTRAASEPAL